jgi:hypothetical protein
MRAIAIHRAVILSACLLGCSSMSVIALDLTPDSAPILSDPAYLPSGRQLVGATTYEFAGTDSQRVLSQSLSYGILNDLAVWASASYAWSNGYYNDSSGLDVPTFSDRFEPIVGVTARLLDQGPYPINLDVSVAAPGQIGSAVSWQTRDLTILGRAGVYYAGRNTDVDRLPVFYPFWAYFVQFESQMRFTHALSLNAGVKYTSPFGGTYFSPSNTVDFDARLNYQVIGNRLVLQAGYKQQWSESSLFALPTNHTFSIGLLYSL